MENGKNEKRKRRLETYTYKICPYTMHQLVLAAIKGGFSAWALPVLVSA